MKIGNKSDGEQSEVDRDGAREESGGQECAACYTALLRSWKTGFQQVFHSIYVP